MTRTLAFLAALTAFALAAQAVKDHATVIRTGYEISRLERAREEAITGHAEARERVGRLASPDALVQRARELGLVTDERTEFPVVRILPEGREVRETVLVQGR